MYLSTHKPWFSFLVHPRNISDLDTVPAARIIRDHSSSEAEYVAKATTLLPLVVGNVIVSGTPVIGEIIAAIRMPEQIMGPDGLADVTAAGRLAADRGASIIGLGALTAPATGGGLLLRKHIPAGVAITTGNGLTAAIAVRNIREAAGWLNLGRTPRVCVLGATGSVGGAASQLLADEDSYDLTLIGRNRGRMESTLADLARRAALADSLDVLHDGDIVLSLTNHATATLDPRLLKPGSVVIDVAQPKNITADRIPLFAKSGIAVADGALVRIPGYRCGQEFALPGPEDTFACLAETYVLAREGLMVDSLGRATADHARLVAELSVRHDVHARPIAGELNAASSMYAGNAA